jgi:hypothetical protein
MGNTIMNTSRNLSSVHGTLNILDMAGPKLVKYSSIM